MLPVVVGIVQAILEGHCCHRRVAERKAGGGRRGAVTAYLVRWLIWSVTEYSGVPSMLSVYVKLTGVLEVGPGPA
jgi:hypothetical protein